MKLSHLSPLTVVEAPRLYQLRKFPQSTDTYFLNLRYINERMVHLVEGLPSFLNKKQLECGAKDPLEICVEEYFQGYLNYIKIS